MTTTRTTEARWSLRSLVMAAVFVLPAVLLLVTCAAGVAIPLPYALSSTFGLHGPYL